jgi:site-specific recombinase XerC
LKDRHLKAILDETGAARICERTPDLLESNLRAYRDAGFIRRGEWFSQSARSVNFRRQIAVAFMSWLVKVGRAESNPLGVVNKLDERRDRRRVRRALADNEFARLLSVARARGREL